MIHFPSCDLLKPQSDPRRRRQLYSAIIDNNKHDLKMQTLIFALLLLAHLGVGASTKTTLSERKLVRRLISYILPPTPLPTSTTPPANKHRHTSSAATSPALTTPTRAPSRMGSSTYAATTRLMRLSATRPAAGAARA